MRTLDRIMALLAFATLLAFLGIVAVRVARVDLTILILLGLSLAGYDLWSQIFGRRR